MATLPNLIVSIEGNIGTGKSTFLKALGAAAKRVNRPVVFLQEPVDRWITLTDSDGKNILEKFYEDKKRWTYAFQMNTFITRAKLIEAAVKENSGAIIVIERSVLADKFVFMDSLRASGDVTAMEMKLYDEWFDWIVESHHVGPNAIIYLAAPAVVSFGRMQMRARPAEKDISYSYLASLHDRHEKWLSGNALAYRVDATEDFLADPDVLRAMIDNVVAVLNNL